ncbi:unnamed protein product [Symbiodinium microadriaticum]|nr:unnamed protein product [Symbiodinium microadriaticum]
MASPGEQQAPWTFHTVSERIGGNKYEDVSGEVLKSQSGGPGRPGASSGPSAHLATAWWNDVKVESWPEQQSSYWSDNKAAVEIETALPESRRGQQRAWENLGGFFVGSMRRRAVELSERRMSPQDLEAFRGAKAIEVKNFVASKAFEILPDHLKPDRSQAIGMRWTLTWKLKEDGTRKAKADETTFIADGVMETMEGPERGRDWSIPPVTNLYPDQLFCIPCPEICAALGVQAVERILGCIVTDSRNVYDKLETEVLVIKRAEKRTSIELLALKESQMNTKVQMRWLHSEAQLANTLTKSGGQREYDLYYKMGHRWRLVEDESMMSARRRKEQGLRPLEQSDLKSRVSGCVKEGSDQLESTPEKL